MLGREAAVVLGREAAVVLGREAAERATKSQEGTESTRRTFQKVYMMC